MIGANLSRAVYNHMAARGGGPAPDALNRGILAHSLVGSIYESVHHWLELPSEQRPAPQTLATAVADFNMRGLVAPQPLDFPHEKEQETIRLTVNS